MRLLRILFGIVIKPSLRRLRKIGRFPVLVDCVTPRWSGCGHCTWPSGPVKRTTAGIAGISLHRNRPAVWLANCGDAALGGFGTLYMVPLSCFEDGRGHRWNPQRPSCLRKRTATGPRPRSLGSTSTCIVPPSRQIGKTFFRILQRYCQAYGGHNACQVAAMV